MPNLYLLVLLKAVINLTRIMFIFLKKVGNAYPYIFMTTLLRLSRLWVKRCLTTKG